MTYYEYLLPNSNDALRRIKRLFLMLAMFHFVSGSVVAIVMLTIYWVFAIIPAVWFLMGIVYGNIAYIFVTDYKYVYDNGRLSIYKHRKYGKYRKVIDMDVNEIDWGCVGYGKQKNCTNCPSTTKFVYRDVLYVITVDEYMQSLLKGEINVS